MQLAQSLGTIPSVLAPGGGQASPAAFTPTLAGAALAMSSPSSSSPAGAAAGVAAVPGAQSPQEAAKAVRGTIDRLLAAKAAIAGDPMCADNAKSLDLQIAAARMQLSAVLPVEVAVKGTIAPAAQARQAVTKAETKLARIESQVAALMASHEVAAQELAECRRILQEAEAATARAAAVALPRADVEAVLANDPGAVWAAMVSFIRARLPGMSPEFISHIGAATDVFQTACAHLPVAPAAPSGPSGLTAPPHMEVAAKPPVVASANGIAPNANPHGALLQPSSPTVPSQFEAVAAAATTASETPATTSAGGAATADDTRLRQQQIQRDAMVAASAALAAHPARGGAAAPPAGTTPPAELVPPLPATEVERLRRASEAAQREHQRLAAAADAAAAAASALHAGAPQPPTQPTQDDSVAVHGPGGSGGSVPGSGPGDDSDRDLELDDTQGDTGVANDSMGGGAADGILNKRPAAEQEVQDALAKARGVAARAKARAV